LLLYLINLGYAVKQELSWGLYDNLDKIKEKVRSFLEEFSSETIASIAGWDYLRAALATLCMILEKWYYQLPITNYPLPICTSLT
jgi:hypothetical protein